MSQGRILKVEIVVATAAILLLFALTWAFGFFDDMSVNGVIALILGVVLSTVLGVGLMALVFISSRGRDEAVHHPPPREPDNKRRDG
ncbi:MAG: hypothetical protein IT562_00635 [Alphaproteobacteria bacterium]|nr:hypothetical protein [Alphaproteobacteria bacterium]